MRARRCADCGHRASERGRFCEQCGAPLTPTAVPLRAPSELEARMLAQRGGVEGERKQVTVMFTDIVSSMMLTRSLEAERWGAVLDAFLGLAARAVHDVEGTVSRFTGDGLMAIFGAPLAHEDHARRACLAVLELHRGAAQLAAELAQTDGVEFAVRCGLNSGHVVIGDIGDDVHMEFVPLGNTIALGRRIESLAPAGSTAISTATAALVEGEFELRELGEFELKGAEGRHRVLELVGPGTAPSRLEAVAATRGLSRFVGRAAEREALDAALGRALAGNGGVIAIVGDPGVGKSRLVHEFVAGCRHRGLTVSTTRGVAHGRHVPFRAVLVLLRDWFGIDEHAPPALARRRVQTALLASDVGLAADLPVLFDFLGIAEPLQALAARSPEAHRRKLLDLARGIVQAGRRHAPAVLVVEDLHWLDDASAEYLEHLAAAVVGTQVVLVCTARPEHEAAWLGETIHLGPLDAGATGELLAGLLGPAGAASGLTALIQKRACGNPFFVEEIVRTLADSADLAGARGDYQLVHELEGVVLPPTVEAALAARIDRLPRGEKALVQTMSVIGQEIPGPVLRAVCGLDEGRLAGAVDALSRSNLVTRREDRGDHAFTHPLTQEVAYSSQLSEQRARTHRAVAAAIEHVYRDGLDERAALLAHHCEAAGDLLDGAVWHARAAGWAEKKSPADAVRHWRRVSALISGLEPSPQRDELATRTRVGMLGLAWRLGMAPEDSAAIHAEGWADAERLALDLNYAATLMHSGRERMGLELFRDVNRRAVASGDPGSAITSACGVSYAAWIAGSLHESVDVIDQAIELADGDPTTGAGLAFVCPYAHLFGQRGQALGYMGQFERAYEDFARGVALAREHGDPEVASYQHANIAMLQATIEDSGAALDNARLGLAIAERAGNGVGIVAASAAAAVAAAGAGQFDDALARAQPSLATIRRDGFGRYYEPVLLGTIARCMLALGRPDDAVAAGEEAVAIMAARGLTTCALPAPIALAQVLIATQGPAASRRVEALLAHATAVARDCQAHVFEIQIDRERASLARVSVSVTDP